MSSDFYWSSLSDTSRTPRTFSPNVARDPEVHAHRGLIDFKAAGVAGRIPVYKSNWTVRAGMRAYREVARMNRRTRLDALFFHTRSALATSSSHNRLTVILKWLPSFRGANRLWRRWRT